MLLAAMLTLSSLLSIFGFAALMIRRPVHPGRVLRPMLPGVSDFNYPLLGRLSRVVSRRRRCASQAASAVNLPRAHRPQVYVLVPLGRLRNCSRWPVCVFTMRSRCTHELAGSHLEAFFTDRLIKQRQSSPFTVAAYRDTFRLLLDFVYQSSRKPPSELESGRSRCPFLLVRSWSIWSRAEATASGPGTRAWQPFTPFFDSLHSGSPEHAALIQRVLGEFHSNATTAVWSPSSLTRRLMPWWTAPDCSTWMGRRDHALLMLAVQTGLRVSELAKLECQDVVDAGASNTLLPRT